MKHKCIKKILFIIIIFFSFSFILIDFDLDYTIKIGKYDEVSETSMSNVIYDEKYLYYFDETHDYSIDGSGDIESQYLYCHNIKTGELIWKKSIFKSLDIIPNDLYIHDNKLYVTYNNYKTDAYYCYLYDLRGNFLEDFGKKITNKKVYYGDIKFVNNIIYFIGRKYNEGRINLIVEKYDTINNKSDKFEIKTNNYTTIIDTPIYYNNKWYFFCNVRKKNNDNYNIEMIVTDNNFNIIKKKAIKSELKELIADVKYYKNTFYLVYRKEYPTKYNNSFNGELYLKKIDLDLNSKLLYKKKYDSGAWFYDFDIQNNKLYIPFSVKSPTEKEMHKYGYEDSLLLIYDLNSNSFKEYRFGNFTADYTMQLSFVNDTDVLLRGRSYALEGADYIFHKGWYFTDEEREPGYYHSFVVRINDIDKQLKKK